MRLIADLDELNVDANLIAGALNAAFEHITHIQDAAYFGDGFADDNFGRGRGDHAEVRGIELAECGTDDVGEPVRDVIGLGIAAEISERENSDANFLNRGNRRPKPAVQAKREGGQNRESENGNDDALPYRRIWLVWMRGRTRSRGQDRRLHEFNGSGSAGHCLFAGETGVSFGVILGLTLLDPGIELARIGIN